MIKNIMTAIMNIHLVIIWLILLPFIYLCDRLFGGWKNDKIFQLEFVKDNEKKDVFCLVSLIRIKRLNFDYEIYLKEMDETVHPYYYKPSNEVFNLLTPLKEKNSFAGNWRSKVKENQ